MEYFSHRKVAGSVMKDLLGHQKVHAWVEGVCSLLAVGSSENAIGFWVRDRVVVETCKAVRGQVLVSSSRIQLGTQGRGWSRVPPPTFLALAAGVA